MRTVINLPDGSCVLPEYVFWIKPVWSHYKRVYAGLDQECLKIGIVCNTYNQVWVPPAVEIGITNRAQPVLINCGSEWKQTQILKQLRDAMGNAPLKAA